MRSSLKVYAKKIGTTLFKHQSKVAVCSKVLMLLLALQPVISSACYVYWHHAPDLPESMKMNIEVED